MKKATKQQGALASLEDLDNRLNDLVRTMPDILRSLGEDYTLPKDLNDREGLNQSIAHALQHLISSKIFDREFISFAIDPTSEKSQFFLSQFKHILRTPPYDQSNSNGDIAIIKPKNFVFTFQLIRQTSQILEVLMEHELVQEMENILELIIPYCLPYLEQKVATVSVSNNNGLKFTLMRCNFSQLSSIFQNFKTFYLVKKGDVQAAELTLNRAQELRDQQDFNLTANEAEFNTFLGKRKKEFRTDYLANKSEWNEAIKLINTLTGEFLVNTGDCIHYLLCGEIAALQEIPDFSLIEHYCDLSITYLSKIKLNNKFACSISPFTATAALLHKIADSHKAAGRLNSALRCYQKAFCTYTQGKEQFIASKATILESGFNDEYFKAKFKKIVQSTVAVNQSITEIQKLAFEQFKLAWSAIKLPDAIQVVEFEEQGFAMKLTLSDTALFKVWMQQLHQLPLFSKPLISPAQKNSVTLLNIHQLSAQQLFKSLERAQKVRQADIMRMQKKLSHAAEKETQRAEDNAKPKKDTVDNSNMDYQSSADKDLYPEPRTTKLKKQSSAVTQKTIAKPSQARPQPHNVSWKEDLPEYVNEDQVYPIPDPFVANSCIPKGIFYGYIDHQMINEIDDDLLLRFQEVLSRGMIAGSDDAQGIRPVQGELGHDSDYYFKINIGRQNYRLYGRKVGEKQLPNGQMVVLIAFDQAIPHDQTLKLGHNEEATYQSLNN